MKKYEVGIPLCATVYVEVEADNEDEAIDEAIKLMDKNKIDFDGYDPEPPSTWWAEEETRRGNI